MHRFSDDEIQERASLYALGALSQHEARAFEEHLEDCAVCAEELEGFAEVVGALGFDATEATPPARVREQLSALVVAEAQTLSAEPCVAAVELPLVTLRADEGEWHEVHKGLSVKRLYVDSNSGLVTTLVKMSPGASIPLHRHRGIEQCYVIEGDARAAGQSLGPGDFQSAPKDSIHAPVYTETGALLLIIAPESYEVLEHH